MVKFPIIKYLSEKELKELSLKEHKKYHSKLASVWRNQLKILVHTYPESEYKSYKIETDKSKKELEISFKLMSAKKGYKSVDSISFKKHWVITWLDWDYKTHKTISLKNPDEYGKKAIASSVRGKVREITGYYRD